MYSEIKTLVAIQIVSCSGTPCTSTNVYREILSGTRGAQVCKQRGSDEGRGKLLICTQTPEGTYLVSTLGMIDA